MDAGLRCEPADEIPPASVTGRLGKLAVGGVQLWYSMIALRHFGSLVTPSLEPEVWLLAALGFLLLPFAVNLGYRKVLNTGWKPLWLALAAVMVAGFFDAAVFGRPWGPVSAVWILAVTLYVHLHVGVSHLLAAVTGLPGCEMRVIPYYLTRITDAADPAQPHLCPGCWTPIDHWEARLKERLS